MVKEQFYGLRWFITTDAAIYHKIAYPISCHRDGYFVESDFTKINSYPDRGSQVHWVYWAKHPLLVPEKLNEW